MAEQNNMVKTEDVIERIKDVICHEYKDKKVFDKNVAYELGVEAKALSVQKTRNYIPYDELTMFAIRRKVNVNWLFFGIGQMEMSYA